MAKTAKLLNRIAELEQQTGIKRTIFAACPNSPAVIKAAFRAAKRNNAPIYFAATLNQIDTDRGYMGLTQKEFTTLISQEAQRVNFMGDFIIAVDHGGPWLKDKQRVENWSTEDAMNGVKKSFEASLEAGYDLIHVDPTVDINVPKGEIIDINLVVKRTVELIKHTEDYRTAHNIAPIDYEVGTEEVHGGLADDKTFETFLHGLKAGLAAEGLGHIWPCFIVGKVGTDLHTTTFDPVVAKDLTSKVRPYGSWIKGHYSDGVSNPEDYPTSGMGGANVGPEFTISEYEVLCELEALEQKHFQKGDVALCSNMVAVLTRLVKDSNRWQKWLQPSEQGLEFEQITPERRLWLVQTGCRYIWQSPEAIAARVQLFANLERLGYAPEEILLGRIERDMDKYFRAFNLIGLNDLL